MERLLILIIGYLFGSLQTAIIIGRLKGLDIRSHGSGNAGTTNALRVLGLKFAAMVFAGDMLKAVVAIVIAKLLFAGGVPYLLIGAYAGLGAILGHNWPVYFQFKGGKGIAVSMATLLMIDYRIGLLAAILFIAIVVMTRYVSLGSMFLTLSAPISFFVFHKNEPDLREIIILIIIIPLLAIYQHRANIGRLLKGTESKLGQKTK